MARDSLFGGRSIPSVPPPAPYNDFTRVMELAEKLFINRIAGGDTADDTMVQLCIHQAYIFVRAKKAYLKSEEYKNILRNGGL